MSDIYDYIYIDDAIEHFLNILKNNIWLGIYNVLAGIFVYFIIYFTFIKKNRKEGIKKIKIIEY